MKLSAIIVAYNEELLINQIIDELKKQQLPHDFEIILADGGSTDQTVAIAKARDIKVVSSKSRAAQMNAAAKEAKGEILFFVHADMRFPDNTFLAIIQKLNLGYLGGGFANVFDSNNEKIKRIGTLLNFRFFDRREQSDRGIFYGDNGIFVQKEIFQELNGFKEIPIMEDYDFSKRMSKKIKTTKIKEIQIIVSARRHIKSGFIKTRLQWIIIRRLYELGVSPFTLEKYYKHIR